MAIPRRGPNWPDGAAQFARKETTAEAILPKRKVGALKEGCEASFLALEGKNRDRFRKEVAKSEVLEYHGAPHYLFLSNRDQVIKDPLAPQPDELVAEEQVRRGVRECLGHLTEREAVIMRLRYGLDAHEPHSLREIGALYGISRERVRQLEKQAFGKLRRLQQSAVLAELVQ